MYAKLEKNCKIAVSRTAADGRVSLPGIFSLFMDLASEHGSEIGLGMDTLAAHGLIWLAIRTKVKINSRPAMFAPVTLSTWPREPGRARCDRYYSMSQEGNLLIEAKNEWAMLEPATGRLRRITDVYPRQLNHCPDTVCDVPYHKVSDDFAGCEKLGEYTVTSSDTDTSRHMNNVQYVRAAFGMFTNRQLEAMDIAEVEIAYRLQCFEGETLSLYRRETENGFDIGIIKEGGKTAATLRVLFRQ